MLFDLVVWMTVRNKKVDVAVIVVIEKLYAPTAHEAGRAADADWNRNVVKRFVVAILVDGVHFLIDIGYEQILPAVLIEVGSVHAHSGSRVALLAECDARRQADLLEFAVAAVAEEKILNRIVGDEEIHPAVIVDVGRDDTPCFAKNFPDARFSGDVRESTIAIVVKQQAARWRVNAGDAVVALAGAFIAAKFAFGFIEVDETANEQIEFAVIVVVKPDGAGRPTRGGEAGFFGNVGESAVAIVAIENVAAILGNVEIGEAVPVVISDCNTHSVAATRYAPLLRDVAAGVVAIVFVKRVAQRRIWLVEVTFSAVDEINVHPAVVVVIEKRAASSGGLREIVFGGTAVDMTPRNAAACRTEFFKQRTRLRFGSASDWLGVTCSQHYLSGRSAAGQHEPR